MEAAVRRPTRSVSMSQRIKRKKLAALGARVRKEMRVYPFMPVLRFMKRSAHQIHRHSHGLWPGKPQVAVNFTSMDLDRALGVPSFGIRLTKALIKAAQGTATVALVVPPPQRTNRRLEELLDNNAIIATPLSRIDLELRLHQFQERQPHSARVVTVIHDFHPFDVPFKYDNPMRTQARVLANIFESDAVVTHFPRTFELLRDLVSDRAHLIPSPTMLSNFDETANIRASVRGFFEAGREHLFYPAQFQAHKNHFNALKAIAELVHVRGRPVKLALTGSTADSNVIESVGEAVAELSLNDSVVNLGFVSEAEIDYLYKHSDLVVQPSLAEGGAYIVQEAISRRTHAVAARIDQVEQHLQRLGGPWRLFDPLDPIDIADTIEGALDDSSFNQVAYDRIQSWTWQRCADDLLQIFKTVHGRM